MNLMRGPANLSLSMQCATHLSKPGKKGAARMAQALEDVLSTFTPEQRVRVEARAQALIEEELTLHDLRHTQHLTQERMAELLGVEQENVSRIERRADVLLSTLACY
jgi:DNA-directed RNA polymerase specialized sigma subunit